MNKSGILLHITSLPGKEATGTIRDGLSFVDELVKAGQKIWQILPINPTDYEGSPFQGPSVFAGNPNLISLESLMETGDLQKSYYSDYLKKWQEYKSMHKGRSDNYLEKSFLWKYKLGFEKEKNRAVLMQAFQGFQKNNSRKEKFQIFCDENKYWLEDYAFFMALKEKNGFSKSWDKWSKKEKFRENGFREIIDPDSLEFYKYLQFVFDEQMKQLHKKASENNIELIGDIPIYPGFDSSDVWANKKLFQLKKDGSMKFVSGVPPDYFSKTGQKWGTPVYKWGIAGTKQTHTKIYYWWAKRMQRCYQYLDTIKIDHFRGFIGYARVPAKSKTAKNAKWVRGPGKELFEYIDSAIPGKISVIAEDLGVITSAVKKQLKNLGYPGMRILLFADPTNPKDHHLPENAEKNCVIYTGTHDNETFMQKIHHCLNQEQQKKFLDYLNQSQEKETNWKAIDIIFKSKAERAIIPMQDVLGLGKESRMNNPSQSSGQWSWRMTKENHYIFIDYAEKKLKELTRKHGRS